MGSKNKFEKSLIIYSLLFVGGIIFTSLLVKFFAKDFKWIMLLWSFFSLPAFVTNLFFIDFSMLFSFDPFYHLRFSNVYWVSFFSFLNGLFFMFIYNILFRKQDKFKRNSIYFMLTFFGLSLIIKILEKFIKLVGNSSPYKIVYLGPNTLFSVFSIISLTIGFIFFLTILKGWAFLTKLPKVLYFYMITLSEILTAIFVGFVWVINFSIEEGVNPNYVLYYKISILILGFFLFFILEYFKKLQKLPLINMSKIAKGFKQIPSLNDPLNCYSLHIS